MSGVFVCMCTYRERHMYLCVCLYVCICASRGQKSVRCFVNHFYVFKTYFKKFEVIMLMELYHFLIPFPLCTASRVYPHTFKSMPSLFIVVSLTHTCLHVFLNT